MKKFILFTMLSIGLLACNKEVPIPQHQTKIYWGNAIYNPSTLTRDFSTYQSYPYIMPNSGVNGDVIILQPKSTINQPSKSADDMIIGDTCYFMGLTNNFGYCYLYDVTIPIKGYFQTTRKVILDTCTYSNRKIIRGSIILNNDNSIDLEYTDSVLTSTNQINHYSIHYTK